MKIALVGNPNSGKTTLFNSLTKGNSKVGNYMGVTVEKKSGRYYKDKSIEIIDLPGVYSLSPYSPEEKVTKEYLDEKSVDVIINIVDSTNLERNLNLTMQVLSLKTPTVIALNMEDALNKSGVSLNLKAIRSELNVPCVTISALKNRGIEELIDTAKKESTNAVDYKTLQVGKNEEENLEIRQKYIKCVIDTFRVKGFSKSNEISDKIDRVVLNKYLAFPIFAAVIFAMYYVSIQTIGTLAADYMEYFFGDVVGAGVNSLLISINAAPWLISLVVDGIIAGVGGVLTFIPQILMLFLFISVLEGSGYMARVAFIMDRLFRKIGLSGKSFIPMIIGCGCSVPAIMGSKTIENQNERRATIILTPFIPCSAKLPVFALIAGIVFPNNAFIAPSMYFLGIFMVILCGFIINLVKKRKSKAETFVMEMPEYRVPALKNVLIELWEKAKGFLVKAGTIIFVASVLLWFLQSYNFSLQMVDTENSMLATLGRIIAPLFAPLGFGDWRSAVALITGFAAKETVLTTFYILLGGTDISVAEGISAMFTPQAAYAFMAFNLLAAPCAAAVGATHKEIGSTKWTLIAVTFQTVVAYCVALLINQMGNLLGYFNVSTSTLLIVVVIVVLLIISIRKIIAKRKCGSCMGCSACNNSSCDKDKK